jgi:light-regulated signal transduction histidine kinase (bacteriophytochrome)
MEHLLDELKDLSLIGRVETPCQDLSLGELAREAVELLSGRIADRGVQIEIGSDLPRSLSLNPSHFEKRVI